MAFSATESAFEGFRLMRREPLAVVMWALFYLVVVAVTAFALGGMFMGFFENIQALENAGSEPTLSDIAPILGFYAVLLPGAIIIGSIIYGAVNRAVLRPQERGFGYLQFGGDELRIIAVSFILVAIFLGIAIAISLAIGVIIGVAQAAMGDAAAFIAIPAVIAFYCAIIWAAVRFSLAIPITVAERRIAVFDSWRMTKGRFWSLFGMMLLAAIMAMVVYVLFSIVAAPIFFFALGGLENIEALQGMAPVEIMSTMAPFAIAALIFYALLSAVMAAITYAPAASAYLGLTGRDAEADAAPPASTEPEL